ncbi:MAG: trigger factor [Antricoccus sp.]
MKSTVETLSTTRVKLTSEVGFDEIKTHFDAAYKQIGAQVRIPGFRPGKVPPRVLEQRVGRGAVLDEVVKNALPEKYGEAMTEQKLSPLGQPEVAVTDLGDESFTFTAEVDIRPEFEIPAYDSVEVTVEDVKVEEADIDEQVESLRDQFSTLKSVDRVVQDGDFVSIDLVAKVNGNEVEGGTASGLSYEVGTNQLIPGIDEALVGMADQDEKTFATELVAGDQAGESADVTVTVNSIKEKELPDLDDEFAQLASEFDTLDELKEDLRTRLARVKDFERIGTARDKVVEALLEKISFDLPEAAMKTELEAREHDAVHAFDHDEAALNAWIDEQGKTREEFDAETKENAEKSLRAQLLLDAIAEKEEIGVDESELTNHIISQAQRYQMAPQQFADEIAKAGQVPALVSDVRRNKALELILGDATIKDESGQTLDLGAIQAEAMQALGNAGQTGETIDADADADADVDAAADEPDEALAEEEN